MAIAENYTRLSEKGSILSVTIVYSSIDEFKRPPYESVDLQIDQLRVLLDKSGTDNNTSKSLLFTWGSQCFRGILKKMDVDYTMFSSNGTPVKAEVKIQIIGNESNSKLV